MTTSTISPTSTILTNMIGTRMYIRVSEAALGSALQSVEHNTRSLEGNMRATQVTWNRADLKQKLSREVCILHDKVSVHAPAVHKLTLGS